MEFPVLALLAGKAVPLARGEKSAISKQPLSGRVHIGLLGVEGDEQADLRVHGGPEKALHHYPFDHYARWAVNAPDSGLLNLPGAFGENVSTYGLSETDVCIGDRLRLGRALIEVSQPRQPCWKQGARLGWDQLPAMMVKERLSGWYYRVIEEGEAQEGDMLSLVSRSLPDWTVARVFGLVIAGDHKRDPGALPHVRDMELLEAGWRQRANNLIGD